MRLGVEALLDVQRRGLEAAGDLVDRLVRSVDGPADETGSDERGGRRAASGDAADPPSSPRTHANGQATDGTGDPLDELARAWAGWVRRGLSVLDGVGATADDGFPPTADGTGDRRAGPDLSLAADGAIGVVRLTARADGSARPSRAGGAPASGSAEVWLHNRGPHDRTGVAVRAGPLLGAGGTTLPARAVRLSPAVFDLPARSSRGLTVTVRTRAVPDTYRGVVVAAGEPDAWLAVEVVVAGGPSGVGDGDDRR